MMSAETMGKRREDGRFARFAWRAALAAAALPMTGCVTVNAPEKPIEINLNVHISQEVVYRLDKEMTDLIEENPGIF